MLEKALLDFFILQASNLQDAGFEIFSEPISILVLLVIGFAVGVSIGVSGFGVTPILVPSLIAIGGIPHLIVGTVLAVTVIAKGFATGIQGKIHNINWKVVSYLFIPVIPSMIFASWIWIFVEENYGSESLDVVVMYLLGFVLIAVTVYLVKEGLSKKDPGSAHEFRQSHRLFFTKKAKAGLLSGGGIVSFITQITSAGAGPMFLPLLVRILRSPKYSAATVTIAGLLVAAVGSVLHYNIGNVTLSLVVLIVAGSIPGVLVGIKIASSLSSRRLIQIFAILSASATIFLLVRGTITILQ